jgi:hypothetical protein
MMRELEYLFPSIHNYVVTQRVRVTAEDGIVRWDAALGTQPTPAEIAAATLPSAKAVRIAEINADCRSRLLARYGTAEEQVSRSIGVYGLTEQTAMPLGIAATVDASNTASNAVIAAADIAAVEAVTVAWPVI